jgi:ATP-dependent DNA helicase RecQ
LLRYFGEESATECGNCDVCLNPPVTWDATIAAQKLLSCVLRTGQRFGPGHVIDVLLGKTSDKVAKHGHDTLSTFGIGGDLTDAQWRSVVRQLLVRGYLHADVEKYGALVLTRAGRPLLRGDMSLRLREGSDLCRCVRGSAVPPTPSPKRTWGCGMHCARAARNWPTRRTFRHTSSSATPRSPR